MASLSSPPSFRFGVRLGIFLTVEAAGLSALAVSTLLSYVSYRTYRRIQYHRQLRKRLDARGDLVFDAADSSFFLNLMLADLIQALGGLLNIRWVAEAHITEGAYCTTQGVLKQMGDVGVALTSLAIAFQTFFVLVLRIHIPTFVNKIIIALIWVFIAVVIGIGTGINNKHGGYYGNTDYWCWIRSEYKVERIVLEYLWMWIAGGIMLILYGLIALVMRGMLLLDFKNGICFNMEGGVEGDLLTPYPDKQRNPKNIQVANLMLFYPAVYIFCILPVCIVRWLDFSGHSVPPGATIFASVVFSLSGLFNVTLYYFTRPQLITGPRLPTIHKYNPRPSRECLDGVRHKLGHLPDHDQGSLPDEDGQGYIPKSSPGRLPDLEYTPTHGRLPSMDTLPPGAGYAPSQSPNMDYTPSRGQLLNADYRSGHDQSLWTGALGPRPGSRDTATSGV